MFIPIIKRTTSEKGVEEHKIRTSIEFYNNYLNIIASEPKIEFDYDYLLKLTPVQMRFYELTQFLRNREDNHPLSTIELSWKEFAELMPLPNTTKYDEIKLHLSDCCDMHIKYNYLQDYQITQSKNGSEMVNFGVIFQFQ